MPLEAFFFFEDVPSVEFMYLIFTRTPGGVTVGDSRACCCAPGLSSDTCHTSDKATVAVFPLYLQSATLAAFTLHKAIIVVSFVNAG